MSFVPNSFQCPNSIIDKYMAHLTGSELKVLMYLIRKIFGFSDSLSSRQRRVSLGEISGGRISSSGVVYDYGTGLSLTVVREAVQSLVDLGIVKRVDSDEVGASTMFEIPDNDDVDMVSLLGRSAESGKSNQEKASQARDHKQKRLMKLSEFDATKEAPRAIAQEFNPEDGGWRVFAPSIRMPDDSRRACYLFMVSAGMDTARPLQYIARVDQWVNGGKALARVCDGDWSLINKAVKSLDSNSMTVSNPFSIVKTVVSLKRTKTVAPTKTTVDPDAKAYKYEPFSGVSSE